MLGFFNYFSLSSCLPGGSPSPSGTLLLRYGSSSVLVPKPSSYSAAVSLARTHFDSLPAGELVFETALFVPSPSRARSSAPYTLDALNYTWDIHHVSAATVRVQPARERAWRGAAPEYRDLDTPSVYVTWKDKGFWCPAPLASTASSLKRAVAQRFILRDAEIALEWDDDDERMVLDEDTVLDGYGLRHGDVIHVITRI